MRPVQSAGKHVVFSRAQNAGTLATQVTSDRFKALENL